MPSTLTLILDGIWGRPRRFARMRRDLEKSCGPTDVFHYNCSGVACLAAEAIRQRGEPVNVLGFSMGGLVVRAAHESDPSLPIHRAAFINVPHGGSWLAHLGAPFKALRGIRQMRPGSEFLRRLDAADWRIPTLPIWCPFDLLVFPGSSARWARATERVMCAGPIHSWPIFARTMRRRIVNFLAADACEVSGVRLAPSHG